MRDCDARARFYGLLSAHYDDHLIATRAEIVRFVHALGLRTLRGEPITFRRIYRWSLRHGFPLLPGAHGRHRRLAAVTSVLAVQAWILSRPMNGTRELFAIWYGNTRPNGDGRTALEASRAA